MLTRIVLGGWVLSLGCQVCFLAIARARVIDSLNRAGGLIELPIISRFMIEYCWILITAATGAAVIYLLMRAKDVNVKYIVIYVTLLFVLHFVSSGLAVGGLLPLIRLP
jgi:hypothetical protein